VVAAFLAAYEARPSRAESLCDLASALRGRNRVVAAYPFAKIAAGTPRPPDRLFVDDSVYAWRAADELAVSAYWTGHYEESQAMSEKLLAGGELPESERPRVVANVGFCKTKLSASTAPASIRGRS